MAVQPQTSKPTLVLLHGWGLNHAVWQQIVPFLLQNYQVLTPDLPGFGLALQCPSPYTLTAVAAQLAQQIPPQSLVLGWSLGGLIATQLALDFPDKVKALALVASSPCFLAKTDWPGMDGKVLTQFATALSKDLALTVERFLAIQALGSETARLDIKVLKQAVLSLPLPQQQALAGGLQLLAEHDLRTQLANLKMPVAGCYGRLDSSCYAQRWTSLCCLKHPMRLLFLTSKSLQSGCNNGRQKQHYCRHKVLLFAIVAKIQASGGNYLPLFAVVA